MSKLTKEQIQSACTFLDTICMDPNAQPFLEPVDWKELELLDYPQIVKNPMDLQTVKSKLLKGEFANFEEFISMV